MEVIVNQELLALVGPTRTKKGCINYDRQRPVNRMEYSTTRKLFGANRG